MDYKNYIRVENNELMEALEFEPIVYYVKGQFRDVECGELRLFERKVLNTKKLKGEKLQKFLIEKLEKFIEEKESGRFIFVPYEKARYRFPNKKNGLRTWEAIAFYDDNEKDCHKMFLQLAREKALKKEEL